MVQSLASSKSGLMGRSREFSSALFTAKITFERLINLKKKNAVSLGTRGTVMLMNIDGTVSRDNSI